MSETGTPHHTGDAALEVLRGYGVDTMFTLNGGHVWPLYDAAVKQDVRIVDVRHEQTATFAAEAWAKLTRKPGLAVLTAGPGVTNGVSAMTTAHFNGTPLVVLGWPSAAGTVGIGVVAGARPRADRRVDHEVGPHRDLARRQREGDPARGDHGADAAPGAGLRRLPD